MSPDQERRLEEIFTAARNLAPKERTAFLERACAGDAELRRGADSLLEAHQRAGSFLQPTVALTIPDGPTEKAGDRVGRYKLLEQIGEGGFGVVWMAEQEEPVRRRVALKIIKLGMDTREVVARFEAERQALAMMEHPNIARAFDGGATNTGRPFFVMELVKGVPITTYCDAKKLSTRDRVKLFIEVCQAIQHAHQKGIIHRDLKPSNILLTERDDRPVPKVIDFGVAKATEARLTEKTVFTRLHQWIGTPAYMSPEQAGLGSLDVDTRSDVYSLGVLLYELLTGRPPFDTEKLLATGYEAVIRTIREEEPPKPSTRLNTLTEEELSAVATQRGAEPTKLNRLVRGDLDWVVMKAMDKDRRRRYETADSLAADLRHYLHVEPVEARPPGALYVLGKMARRHRAKFAAAASVTLSLVIGLTLSTVLFFRERAARHYSQDQKRHADEQANIAVNVRNFLERDLLLHGEDPEAFYEAKPEPDLKVRTVLDRASERIEGQFLQQPLVEAGLRETLALAYRGLGEHALQAHHLRRELDIYREQFGAADPKTLRAARELGDAEVHLGRTNEGILLLQGAFEDMKRVLGPNDTETLYTMAVLAVAYEQTRQTNAGLELLQKAVKLANDQPGPETEVACNLLELLAGMQSLQGKWPDAIESFRRTLNLRRKLSGPESLRLLRIEANLAATLAHAGRLAEAERMAQTALDGFLRKLGPEHPDVLRAMDTLAYCFRELGRLTEAEPIFRELVVRQTKIHGETHVEVSHALYHLGLTLQLQDRLGEAEEVYGRQLALEKRLSGAEAEGTLTAGRNLVQVLIKAQKFQNAQQLLTDILEIEGRKYGPEHTNTLADTAILKTVEAQAQGR